LPHWQSDDVPRRYGRRVVRLIDVHDNAALALVALDERRYSGDAKLIYAGRVGTGMTVKVLADLRRRLDPLARKTAPLSAPPPRSTRFGSPLFFHECIGSSRSSSPRLPI
jgi:ATP-dependent DNA ligase